MSTDGAQDSYMVIVVNVECGAEYPGKTDACELLAAAALFAEIKYDSESESWGAELDPEGGVFCALKGDHDPSNRREKPAYDTRRFDEKTNREFWSKHRGILVELASVGNCKSGEDIAGVVHDYCLAALQSAKSRELSCYFLTDNPAFDVGAFLNHYLVQAELPILQSMNDTYNTVLDSCSFLAGVLRGAGCLPSSYLDWEKQAAKDNTASQSDLPSDDKHTHMPLDDCKSILSWYVYAENVACGAVDLVSKD